jgi:hypothetical protein
MPSTILSDNGVTSGTSGIKTTGSNDGTLALQTTTAGGAATTALSISTAQVVTLTNALPVASGGSGVTTSTGTGANVLGTSPTITTPTISSLSSASATALTLQSAGTTAITVDTSQNVGIGVTSPAAKLDVSTSTSYGGIKINGANGASINLYQPQSNASARNYQLLTNWEAWGTLDFQRSVDNATAPSVTLMSLNNAGTVVLKGGAISNSGVGIAFPATQVASSDANTLDDYEEGTWTATLTGSTTPPSTPVTATGYYTKIGNLVTVFFRFTNVNTTGASGDMKITGLPFAARAVTENQSPVPMTYGLSIPNKYISGYIGSGDTQIFFQSPADNAAWASVSITAGASKYMNMSMSYQTS